MFVVWLAMPMSSLIDGARWNLEAFGSFTFFGNHPKCGWTFFASRRLSNLMHRNLPRLVVSPPLISTTYMQAARLLIYWIASTHSATEKHFSFAFSSRETFGFSFLWIFITNWIYRQLNNMNYRKFWTRSSDNLNEMLEELPSWSDAVCCWMMQR
jgi:hypothetical protein